MQPVSPDGIATSPFAHAPPFSSFDSHEPDHPDSESGWGFQDVPLRSASHQDGEPATMADGRAHDAPDTSHVVLQNGDSNGLSKYNGPSGELAQENIQLKERLTHLEEVSHWCVSKATQHTAFVGH